MSKAYPVNAKNWRVSEIKGYLSNTFLALSSRDYRLFAFGQAISVSGVWMQKLAQAWLVLVLTDSGLMLGVTVALQQLPTLLLTVSGGAMADRFDRRRILITTNLCSMLPALALGVVVVLDQAQLWMVFAAALFQGLVDALEKPTRMTLVNDIVGPSLLTNAVMLNNIIQNSGKLIGPGLAGILIGTAGVSAAFFVNVATFVPIVIGLVLIRPAYLEAQTSKWRGGLRETMRYVAKRRELAVALGLAAIVGLFGYNFQVVMPLLFRDVFGGDAEAAGFGLTAMGLGGVLGGVAIASRLKATARRQVISAAAFGISMAVLGLAPTLWIGYVLSFIVGAASVTFAATSAAHIQLAADPQMRGRMMGLYVLALAGSSPIGGPLQGGIAQLTNARVSFLVAGGAILLGCLMAYRYGRTRRDVTNGREQTAPPDIRAIGEADAMVNDAT